MTEILGPDGRPARPPRARKPAPATDRCACGAGKNRRVPSGGFGSVKEICGECGRDVQGDAE